MITSRIYETQNLLSLRLVFFLVGLRTYQYPCVDTQRFMWSRNLIFTYSDNVRASKVAGSFRKTCKSSCSRPTSEITAFHTQCWRTATLTIAPTCRQRQTAALYTNSQPATATTNCQGIILKFKSKVFTCFNRRHPVVILILKIK
jgi:hypothetical protein